MAKERQGACVGWGATCPRRRRVLLLLALGILVLVFTLPIAIPSARHTPYNPPFLRHLYGLGRPGPTEINQPYRASMRLPAVQDAHVPRGRITMEHSARVKPLERETYLFSTGISNWSKAPPTPLRRGRLDSPILCPLFGRCAPPSILKHRHQH